MRDDNKRTIFFLFLLYRIGLSDNFGVAGSKTLGKDFGYGDYAYFSKMERGW